MLDADLILGIFLAMVSLAALVASVGAEPVTIANDRRADGPDKAYLEAIEAEYEEMVREAGVTGRI